MQFQIMHFLYPVLLFLGFRADTREQIHKPPRKTAGATEGPKEECTSRNRKRQAKRLGASLALSLLGSSLTDSCAPLFEEIHFFPVGATPSVTPLHPNTATPEGCVSPQKGVVLMAVQRAYPQRAYGESTESHEFRDTVLSQLLAYRNFILQNCLGENSSIPILIYD